jgi:hypothetical protein
MHQAIIIHRAEQLFTSPSIQSFHDGPLWWCFGWVGGCVCVQEGGLGFPLPPTQDFVIQFSRAPSFECKRWNPNYELTCIGMTQKKLVVLLSWVELSWVEILCVGVLILMSYEDKMCPFCSLFNVIEFWVNSLDLIDWTRTMEFTRSLNSQSGTNELHPHFVIIKLKATSILGNLGLRADNFSSE